MRSEVLLVCNRACWRKNRGSHRGNKSAKLCVVTQPGSFHSSFVSSTPLSHLPDATGCSIKYRFTKPLRLYIYQDISGFFLFEARQLTYDWKHLIISLPSMQPPSECCSGDASLCSAVGHWLQRASLGAVHGAEENKSIKAGALLLALFYQEGPRTEGGGTMCVLDSIRKSVRPPKGQGCKEGGCRPV